MTFDRKFLLSAIAAALVPVLESHAETAEALAQRALHDNPELRFYVAGIAAAKGAVRTAGTIRNPELNTTAGYKNTHDNFGGLSGDGGTFAFSFSQTFEYPGRIALRKAIANHDVDLAELHLEQFRLTLAARVRTLAYGVASTHTKALAIREIAGRFQALSDVLAQRPVAGVTPQLEAQLISGNVLTFQRQEREAALAEKTLAAELNQLCGRSTNVPLIVNAGAVLFRPASLPNLLKTARTRAFDVRIRQVELAQQGFKVALSKNERYPAIAVGPFYSLENAADQEQQVGLGISFPLPLWDRKAGDIATSQAREQQVRASLLAAQREVDRRVTQNAATLEAKRAEIEKWKADAVAKFRDAAELADRNYRLGSVPLPIYVETQKQYLEVINALNDAQKDALEAAQELEILTGLKLYKEGPRP